METANNNFIFYTGTKSVHLSPLKGRPELEIYVEVNMWGIIQSLPMHWEVSKP